MNPQRQAIMKPRVAVYGGAFDPVHSAHLKAAKAAYKQASLDNLVFLPAAQSPLKSHIPKAGNQERLTMLELAIEGEPEFTVDDSELRRGGISYTVDTVRVYEERYPAFELFWIIGADQLEQLDRWQAIETLVQRVDFLVLARPGYCLSAPDIPGLAWEKIEAPLMRESSTLIRERIAKGQSVRGLLPDSVEAFIKENGLYT